MTIENRKEINKSMSRFLTTEEISKYLYDYLINNKVLNICNDENINKIHFILEKTINYSHKLNNRNEMEVKNILIAVLISLEKYYYQKSFNLDMKKINEYIILFAEIKDIFNLKENIRVPSHPQDIKRELYNEIVNNYNLDAGLAKYIVNKIIYPDIKYLSLSKKTEKEVKHLMKSFISIAENTRNQKIAQEDIKEKILNI